MTDFSFTLLATDGMARRGRIDTSRGEISTPAFMPVGTVGTVKAMYPEQVRETGADILLGNTYHLMLRPGAERVAALGGLHVFMDWPRPILTDSGGFQVMSLAKLRKLTEQGVTFRSHIDGTAYELTPERSIEIQTLLDSDIIMQLDECIPLPSERPEMERAMELSLRWAQRSKDAFGVQPHRALFGINQGGDDAELRSRSAAGLKSIGFSGYSVGGLAVGEPQETMFRVLSEITPELPADKPRYLMGVGKPDDILGGIERGIDMFDCVHPTRAGRHGHAYTRFGVINLKNARHKDDPRPLDELSPNANCRRFSRAYLHHLVKTEEILGAMILSQVNLGYYQELVQGAREAIASGALADYAAATRAGWARGDLPLN
ncbi:MAG: tRNA guanosine(34) transglycosylase Tgt [Devosia sp. 67-54]|uniref:tRNA guanosine(34) transglycosylase Tgt n=1 Tax=unclassified Devosia TaxID=196773 RepID=UPI0009614BD8|nr:MULTISPECIES: tRNA guanosine(34) transglycosylase Tgt [unclassified Devosia]MBN9304190.1 tRNA guanosine(34) transglycosylase Tgt [Devosia sp.]OJX18009.1 MAG: tRNA guanosine(34) transglycosylase Tgt [Devosia sp. 67-54]